MYDKNSANEYKWKLLFNHNLASQEHSHEWVHNRKKKSVKLIHFCIIMTYIS